MKTVSRDQGRLCGLGGHITIKGTSYKRSLWGDREIVPGSIEGQWEVLWLFVRLLVSQLRFPRS